MRRLSFLFLTSAVMLPFQLSAQLTEPYQTNWNTFGQVAAPLFRNLNAPGATITFATFPQFSGKAIEWEGEFFQSVTGTPSLVLITMNPIAITFSNGAPGILFSVIAEVRSAGDWTRFRQGERVRFRGVIDTTENVALLNASGTNTASMWIVDAEPIVTSNVPPTAVLSVSAQNRTAGNNGTLNLSAPAGQQVAVNFSAAASQAGTGTITAYEWRNNGNIIGTQSQFTANLSAATNDIVLRVTNSAALTATASARINIQVVQPTGPTLSAVDPVVHGASFQRGVAAGTWLTIRGNLLSNSTRIWEGRDFNGSNLPTSLDGVSVRINGRLAYIYFISPTQLNVLSDDDPTIGPVALEVTAPSGTVRTTISLQAYAPGFFAFDPMGRKYPAAVHLDGSFVGPADLFGGAAAARPVNPNETFLAFGSGFGRSAPFLPSGQVVSGPAVLEAASRINISIGGTRATTTFVGLVGSGLNQFNVETPRVPPGDQPFEAELAGARSQPGLFLCVGAPNPATINVGSTALTFNAGPSVTPGPQQVAVTANITNLGFTTRTQTDNGGNWLSATASGAAPTTISVNTTATGLASGTYTGAVFVGSCVAPVVQKINVTLVVAAAGGGGGGGGAAPRITSLNPRSAAVGSTFTLEIVGTGLETTSRINFFQPFNITVSNLQATATRVTATVAIAGTATTGPRNVSVTTSNGDSNSEQFTLLATAAPPTGSPVPAISNGQVSSVALGNQATWRLQFDFVDSDGNIRDNGIGRIEIRTSHPNDTSGCFEVLRGIFLEKPGQTSGTISLGNTFNFTSEIRGNFTVNIVLVDAAGNRSNTLRVPATVWHSACNIPSSSLAPLSQPLGGSTIP